ncbi:MAG TPA: formylglycine-generating enzyme family protein [Gemmataceae bacterium]|nr:formylglycine-generating enzyme family protein [Gemmataceae bacterium]
MTRTIGILIVGLLAITVSAAGDKKKLPDPTARKDAILKLFVSEFVAITPGKGKFPESFMMGTEKGGNDNERPAHKVTFKYNFAIAKYEVTQELYHVVMGKNQAEFQGLRNGMDRVNWNDANEFCTKATKMLRDAKLIGANDSIRLPSEAEWEYCCRAGTKTKWSFGDDVSEIGKYAWWKENSKGEDPPVGKKLPNAWGLYDMHGYVWEWCQDPWHPDYKDAPTDGSARAKADSKDRVLRGGAYPTPADDMRCASRHHADPATRSGAIGFRCVKETIAAAK